MKKRGPKVNPNVGDLHRVSYSLDDMTRRRLSVLGGGNESAGVREAARVAYELWQGLRPVLSRDMPTGRLGDLRAGG